MIIYFKILKNVFQLSSNLFTLKLDNRHLQELATFFFNVFSYYNVEKKFSGNKSYSDKFMFLQKKKIFLHV